LIVNVFTKAFLLYHIMRWRLNWNKRDTHYRYTVAGNPKFMGSRDAVKLIKDGDVVGTSGLAGNQLQRIMYFAIREVYQETGHPANLTFLCTGGQGGRGKVPGSMEEIGLDGLVTRLITGHQETFKSLLGLSQAGKLELQCIPQGILARMIDAQGRGECSVLSRTGSGTFLDPRVGTGSNLFNPAGEQLVAVEGSQLRYRAPRINVAMFSAPAAVEPCRPRHFNGFGDHGRMAEVNVAFPVGGRVIVNVGRIVEKGHGSIGIPAANVDAIVYDRDTEQSLTIKHRRHWPCLTTESDIPAGEAIERLRYVNTVLGITPRRSKVDDALARLGAMTFCENARKDVYLNIGTGLPEEVCRILFEAGLLEGVTVFTESGVIGGIPAPGVFFGGAACPKKMVSSPEVFRLCYEKLDVTILGVLEADGEGNVNVSRRGEGPLNYVGPGGFIDITTAAKTVLFVTAWMHNAQVDLEDGQIKIRKPGKPKFVESVREITFCGKEAIETGKTVFYATTVGVFRLTQRGMELVRVMPGVDIARDILDASRMKIVLPESGHVPVVDPVVVHGRGFKLAFAANQN
jgi:propionate CoA-transferase